MEDVNLHIPELKRAFSKKKFLRKIDLRHFYQAQLEEPSENAFRRILYALEKRALIEAVDAGVYVLNNGDTLPQLRQKFIPVFSPELSELYTSVKAAFPYAEYLIWETKILHEFMIHQPGQSQIILEAEEDTTESIFNFLNDQRLGEVFLQPDRTTFERYILPRTHSIIISKLITQSPHQKVNGIPSPKMEKILVDIFADDEKFYIFHGRELVHIFEGVFGLYQIREKTLFRYAERRKIGRKLHAFIKQETNIQLIQPRNADK